MHQGVMVAAVRETLRKHVVTGDAVCGEKRSRDLFSDLDDDAMADVLDAAMAERYPKRSRVNTLDSVVSGNAVCGEKRSRDWFLDLEDDPELDAAMAVAEGLV